jgi:tetratricopeptide (TPR) repeat protein
MNASTANPLTRWAIFAFTLLVFLIFGISAGRHWYASHLEDSTNPADWLRAARLEPNNGDYWFKVALNRQWSLDDSDANQTLGYFRSAVAIDPRSATYWTELADAYESGGQLDAARDAYLKAIAAYPASSEVHWRYGSFLLRQGQMDQAYAEIHLALTIDPKLIPLAISRVWPATQDAGALLNRALPENLEAQSQALDWFCTEKLVEPALAVWKQMAAAGKPIPLNTVFPLENVLIEAGRSDDARSVWHDAIVAAGKADEANAGDSLVFNGRFDYDPVDGGLDWHIEHMLGVRFDYDGANPHGGRRSLRVSFDGGQNLNFQGVWQTVPVRPNTRYHFQAYLRTAGITSDSGIRFLIYFVPGNQQPLILPDLTGDHPWEEQGVDFTTAPGVQFVRITLYRAPSERFSNKIAGTAWVDDVSLTPVNDVHKQP